MSDPRIASERFTPSLSQREALQLLRRMREHGEMLKLLKDALTLVPEETAADKRWFRATNKLIAEVEKDERT